MKMYTEKISQRFGGRKRQPVHPGTVLADILETSELTIQDLSDSIDISRQTLSLIINGKKGLSVDIALRLGAFFGNGPNIWLNMQLESDIWNTLQKNKPLYNRIATKAKA